MTTRTLKLKTFYGFDANGHCGTVQAKTTRSALRLLREQLGDKPDLAVKVSPHNCPECGGDDFGIHNGEPVTTGGWHGGEHFTWGHYAGVWMPRLSGRRCQDCGYTQDVDPNFDD